MHRHLLEANYRFQSPKPSRFWQRALAPVRRWTWRRLYDVRSIDVRGETHVRAALQDAGTVMFAVNHPAHGDPFMIFETMSRLGVPCCYLAAWQVFTGWMGLKRFAFRRLGAFSIDREGTDVRSFRTAVDVLAGGRHSLVIFPEGEVYHLNDRVTPMREGAAMIALAADRRRRRAGGPGLRIVPCAIKYHYLEDPGPRLEAIMSRLEESIYWRPRPDRPLPDRIYRFAEAVLALKEMEHLEAPGRGPLPQRIERLTEHILAGMEQRRFGAVSKETVPARVKKLRHDVLRSLPGYGAASEDESAEPAPPAAGRWRETLASVEPELEDLHLVVQLFSYPGDYVAEKPSTERIAETIDKFEEDALGARDAGARAPRKATVSFGPALEVADAAADGKPRRGAGPLTARIEEAVGGLLGS